MLCRVAKTSRRRTRWDTGNRPESCQFAVRARWRSETPHNWSPSWPRDDFVNALVWKLRAERYHRRTPLKSGDWPPALIAVNSCGTSHSGWAWGGPMPGRVDIDAVGSDDHRAIAHGFPIRFLCLVLFLPVPVHTHKLHEPRSGQGLLQQGLLFLGTGWQGWISGGRRRILGSGHRQTPWFGGRCPDTIPSCCGNRNTGVGSPKPSPGQSENKPTPDAGQTLPKRQSHTA